MRALAIDIGGTKVSLALIDLSSDAPNFMAVQSIQTSDLVRVGGKPTAGDIVHWVNETSESITRDHGMVEAIGVGFGGQFSRQRQRCLTSLHVSGWDNFALADLFPQGSPLHGLPILGDNDANVAARAEASGSSTAATGASTVFLYLTVSTGIGGAIALVHPETAHVEIVTGYQSLAGELGHLQVPSPRQSIPQLTCACGGTACLERVCSGLWIEQRTGTPASTYLANDGNFADWIADFTTGLWSAVTLLDPAVICIGGGMSAMGERLTQALTVSLGQRCSDWGRKPPEITLAKWGSRSVLLGAALLAREVGKT